MATARESVPETSDIIHDYTCSPCDEGGLNAEAEAFCKQCDKYFCGPCVKLHDGLYRNHVVLGKSQRSLWRRRALKDMGITCLLHDGREVELFCEGHGVVCCLTCASVEHRSCKKVVNMQDASKDANKTYLPDIKDEAASLITSLNKSMVSYRNKLRCMDKMGKQAVEDVKSNARDLCKAISGLEKATLKDICELQAEFTETVNKQIHARKSAKERIGRILSSANNYDGLDKESAFVVEKLIEQAIARSRVLLDEVIPGIDLQFLPDGEIAQIFRSKRALGDINEPPPPPPREEHAYGMTGILKYPIRRKDDGKEPDIVAICRLQNGHIAIADGSNAVVKLLDTGFNIIDFATADNHSPVELFNVRENEFGVAFQYGQQIIFLKDRAGALEQTLKVNISYDMVDFYKEKLYCADMYDINVYSLDGQLERHLFKTGGEDDHIMRIKINADASKMYVANNSSGIWVLDLNGTVLFSSNDLLDVFDLSVSANAIFVCSHDVCDSKANVSQLDVTGTKILATISDDNTERCSSVCFNRRTNQLLVGILGSELCVYQLK